MNDLAAFSRRAIGRTALSVPVLGIGCSTFGNRGRELTSAEVDATVEAALDAGADYFDVAPYYGFGLAERRLGDALRGIDPSSYVISTKVGRMLVPDAAIDTTAPRNGFHSQMRFRPEFDYSYDGVMRSWESSIARLGLPRIDILLVHDIGGFAHGAAHAARFDEFMGGGYRALVELRDGGAIGAFGLGVNECAVCEEVMDAGQVDCILLAGRYTLLEQGALDSLLPRCLEAGTSVIVGGPYNTGLLAGGTRRTGELRYDYGIAPAEIVARVHALEAICDGHGVPIAAAALQFPLAHPAVACVIPGLGSAARVQETASWLRWPIPTAFWDDLRGEGLIDHRAPVATPPAPSL